VLVPGRRLDLDGRKIDFRLIREGEELVARAMKDKGAPREGGGGRGHGHGDGFASKSSGRRTGRKESSGAAQEHKSTAQPAKSADRKATAQKKSRNRR
jgi:ribonuclease R